MGRYSPFPENDEEAIVIGMVFVAEGQTNYKMGLVVVVMGEESAGGNCGVSNCFLNFQWIKTTLILLIMYF